MTGQTSTVHPFILVDSVEDDDVIESTGWVEYTKDTQTPEQAVAFLERQMPLEDREETEVYVCEGESRWLKPVGDEGCWDSATIRDPGATLFWVVNVVCPT
jgi:hypothetical protein